MKKIGILFAGVLLSAAGIHYASASMFRSGSGIPLGVAAGDLGGSYPAPTVVATHLSAPLPGTQGGLGNALPTCGANSFLTSTNGSSTSCAGQSNPTMSIVAVGQTTAGGNSTAAASSSDGLAWSAQTLSTSHQWAGLATNGSIYVATNADTASTAALSSSDGVTWTARSMPSSHTWFPVTYGNGTFVAVANDGSATSSATSTDGITWVAGGNTNNWIHNQIIFGGPASLFVAAGQGGPNSIETSPTGATWTGRTASGVLTTIAASPTLYCAIVSGTGGTVTSTDAITWTSHAGVIAGGAVQNYKVIYSPRLGLFVALTVGFGTGGSSYTSSDCVSWSSGSSLPSANAKSYWYPIETGNLIVAVGDLNHALVSFDGSGWFNYTLPSSQTWQAVAVKTASTSSVSWPLSTSTTVSGATGIFGALRVGTVNAVTSMSERDIGPFFENAFNTTATKLAETTVSNASTFTTGGRICTHTAGVGGGNYVVKACTDGTTCSGANALASWTQACTAAAGTCTANAVNTAAVAAGSTVTFSVTTACATTAPVATVSAHLTTP